MKLTSTSRILILTAVGALPTALPPGGSSSALAQCTWLQEAKLTAVDAVAGDLFGAAVAIDGDTLIVGAWGFDVLPFGGVGAAYVFVRSGTVWSQQAKLTASDIAAGDVFGISVGIDGDTAVVGARDDDGLAGSNQGSAYVYVRSGTTWSEQAKLTASDAMASDTLGTSVAISLDTVIAGARGGDAAQSGQGTAYVFVRSGTTWSQQAELAASDGLPSDGFGISVGIDGETAIVGSDSDDGPAGPDLGSAYVFIRSGTTWSQQAKLIASDGEASDRFGYSVGIDGDRAAVGAWWEERGTPNTLNEGAAYVFSRSGTTWTEDAKLIAPDAAPGDQYGYSVAISGETVAAGAWMDDLPPGADHGSAYVSRCVPPCCKGDMDASTIVDDADIPTFAMVLVDGTGTPDELCAADVNGDGIPDGMDVQAFVDKVLSGGACP